MKCTKCGTELNADTKFCSGCGNSVENNKIESNTELVTKKQKNNIFKDKRIMIGAGVLVALVIIFFIGLSILNKGPKQIFNKSIDELFKTIDNQLINENKPVSSDVNIKAESKGLMGMDEIINNLSVDVKYEMDSNKKIMNFNVKPSYDKIEMLNMSGHFADEKSHVYLDGLFDKYIQIPIDKNEYNKMFEVKNTEDIKVMLKEFKNELKSSLTKEYFSKGKDEIKVNGKDIKVKKSTLEMTNKDLNKFGNKLKENLSKNKKFISAFAKNIGKSEKEVLALLKSNSEDISDYENQKIVISIYTEGVLNKFRGISFKTESDYQNSTIEVVKESNDKYSYTLKSGNTIMADGILSVEDNKNSQVININVNVMNAKLKLIITTKIDDTAKVSAKKIGSSISIDDITDENEQEIMKKLLENKGVISIISAIDRLMYGTGSGY